MSLRQEMESTPIVGDLLEVKCEVNHPAWPERVFVRQFRGSDQRKYETYGYQVTGGKELAEDDIASRIDTIWSLKPFLVCLCLAGEDGKRLFEDGDAGWIEENLSGALITEVSDAAATFNRLGAAAAMEEQKNSESGIPSDS